MTYLYIYLGIGLIYSIGNIIVHYEYFKDLESHFIAADFLHNLTYWPLSIYINIVER